MDDSAATRIPFRRAIAISLLIPPLVACCAQSAAADVIVLANETNRDIPLRFAPVNGLTQSVTLAAGENTPFYLDGKANVSFTAQGGSGTQLVDANCAYFFSRGADGRVDLHKIGLGEDGTLMNGRTLPGSASNARMATITVKILVDEEEPARREVWERRLRHRVEAASAVFEKNFHTKLEVIATDTWKSDDSINDFFASLADFESKVKPAPAQLAIGFTSQWRMVRGRTHMAGTRGPLHTHILAREGSPEIGESEKLEFLIHELGHLMGAAHSPERDSIMRPVLGNNQGNRTNARAQFDPVNTLAMAIISEEMRRRNLTKIGELAPDTRKRLAQIYTELARALPDDPAAFQYAQIMKSESGTPIVVATRQVLKQMVSAIIENRSLPAPVGTANGPKTRRQGDMLTNHLVREAARAAKELPDEVKLQAFLVAAVTGLNDGDPRFQLPISGGLASAIETPSERTLRLTMLGEPTIRDRRDVARHFLLGSLLAATTSAEAAQNALLTKELNDAQSPGGFSFVDIAAGRAGIQFARAVLDKRVSLGLLAFSYSTSAYMPGLDGLSEKLSAKDLAEQFGGKDDPRFVKQLKLIDERISQLPGYQPAASTSKQSRSSRPPRPPPPQPVKCGTTLVIFG